MKEILTNNETSMGNNMSELGKNVLDAYKNSEPEQKNVIIKVLGIIGLVVVGVKGILMLK